MKIETASYSVKALHEAVHAFAAVELSVPLQVVSVVRFEHNNERSDAATIYDPKWYSTLEADPHSHEDDWCDFVTVTLSGPLAVKVIEPSADSGQDEDFPQAKASLEFIGLDDGATIERLYRRSLNIIERNRESVVALASELQRRKMMDGRSIVEFVKKMDVK